jgi:hypothetical protein
MPDRMLKNIGVLSEARGEQLQFFDFTNISKDWLSISSAMGQKTDQRVRASESLE